jgi:hypothetical protein
MLQITVVNMSLRQTAVALSAGQSKLILPANQRRGYLLIENVGANDLTLGWDSAPVAGLGTTLSPGGLGSQGGSLEFKTPGPVPTNAIYAISASGSTIVASEA